MRLVFQLLLLVFVTFNTRTMAAASRIPRLTPHNPLLRPSKSMSTLLSVSNDLETFFYDQTLDHFNYNPESYVTFPQRYLINSNWWGGANTNAPIFAFFGAENPIENEIEIIGFLNENAPRCKALVVYLEHRFYGKSNPVRTNEDPHSVELMEKAVNNKTIRGYFNSAQALADYAELLEHIKKKLHAHHSPIIVIGGSYGGELAAWFRLKYPHIALGALASSAPLLYFNGITPQDGYYSIVTKDFKDISENCYRTIKESWNEIDRVASLPNGLSILSQKFKTCSPLDDASVLKDYLTYIYTTAAQYNDPPIYPTAQICKAIDRASNNVDADILDRVFSGVVAYHVHLKPCSNVSYDPTQSDVGWQWQSCSEAIGNIGITSNVSMFPKSPFDLQGHIDDCKQLYGVAPRVHWMTTYYGGHDIKLVLSKFGSNIIFSNGLIDPYSSGGVLEDISDTILAVKTVKGSHCLDILKSQKTDPKWLIKQRNKEVKIIKQWLRTYYRSVRLLQQSSTP